MSRVNEKELARSIKELRSELGLTENRFAAKDELVFSTVNRWESGKSRPPPLATRQIEELLEHTEEDE
jgi:DNA-binding transcriptional regulator YiaG